MLSGVAQGWPLFMFYVGDIPKTTHHLVFGAIYAHDHLNGGYFEKSYELNPETFSIVWDDKQFEEKHR